MELSGKAEKFCREYIVDFNIQRAEQRSGCSEGYGRKLLKDERVAERICKLQEEFIEKNRYNDRNRVIAEIWNMYEKAMQAKPVEIWDKELKEYVPTGEYQFDDKIAMKCLELIIKLGGNPSEKEGEKSEGIEIIVKVEDENGA
ncbi:MAG: terminase small subunit [Oscillospiraceae bacterium]|nr:terminase small subunit [Oscillospiraceae bacterium]